MRSKLIGLAIAVVCIGAVPAAANLWVDIDIHATELELSDNLDGTYDGVATESTAASVTSYLDAYIIDGFTADDHVRYTMAAGDLVFNLTFSQSGGIWSAIGDLSLKDATSAVVVKGDFTSTSVAYVDAVDDSLEVKGVLVTPTGDDSILQTTGSWT